MRASAISCLLLAVLCSCGKPKATTVGNVGNSSAGEGSAANPTLAMAATDIEGNAAGPQYRMKKDDPAPASPPAGAFGKETIRLGVQRQYQAVQTCYETALATKPTLAGTSTVTFVIGVDGKVTTAAAAGLDPAVDACVAEAVKAAVFPAPTAPTTVTYPLTFKPGT